MDSNGQTENTNQPLTPLEADEGNPCTAQALAKHQFYHQYHADDSKSVRSLISLLFHGVERPAGPQWGTAD